jgi:multisubunit Na+/H+ antiporter MnhF subunit
MRFVCAPMKAARMRTAPSASSLSYLVLNFVGSVILARVITSTL